MNKIGRSRPLRVFLSYSHRDAELVGELSRAAKILEHLELIRIWDDRLICAGEPWAQEVDHNIETADAVLFAVSSSFLASEECWREVRHAFGRARDGASVVLSVILSPCVWENTPLAQYQILPGSGSCVTAWQDRDSAWKHVVQGLVQALSKIKHPENSAHFPRLRVAMTRSQRMQQFLFSPFAYLGRSRELGFAFPTAPASVSKIHARLAFDSERSSFSICDLNSAHGTFLNEKRIDRSELTDGEKVRFGPDLTMDVLVRARPNLLGLRHRAGTWESISWLSPGKSIPGSLVDPGVMALRFDDQGAVLILGDRRSLALRPGAGPSEVRQSTWQAAFI